MILSILGVLLGAILGFLGLRILVKSVGSRKLWSIPVLALAVIVLVLAFPIAWSAVFSSPAPLSAPVTTLNQTDPAKTEPGVLPTPVLQPTSQTEVNIVWYNACTSDPLSADISALKNNGQVVPDAYKFMDKNEVQVPAGDYWNIDVPEGVYGHVFYPMSGLTYQVRGPARIRVGAATFWCDNLGRASDGTVSSHLGMYQMVNAKMLDAKWLDKYNELAGDVVTIGDWVKVPDVANQPK